MEKLPPHIDFNLSYFPQLRFDQGKQIVTADESVSQTVILIKLKK